MTTEGSLKDDRCLVWFCLRGKKSKKQKSYLSYRKTQKLNVYSLMTPVLPELQELLTPSSQPQGDHQPHCQPHTLGRSALGTFCKLTPTVCILGAWLLSPALFMRSEMKPLAVVHSRSLCRAPRCERTMVDFPFESCWTLGCFQI